MFTASESIESIPSYIRANGQSYKSSNYQDLFSLIGFKHGGSIEYDSYNTGLLSTLSAAFTNCVCCDQITGHFYVFRYNGMYSFSIYEYSESLSYITHYEVSDIYLPSQAPGYMYAFNGSICFGIGKYLYATADFSTWSHHEVNANFPEYPAFCRKGICIVKPVNGRTNVVSYILKNEPMITTNFEGDLNISWVTYNDSEYWTGYSVSGTTFTIYTFSGGAWTAANAVITKTLSVQTSGYAMGDVFKLDDVPCAFLFSGSVLTVIPLNNSGYQQYTSIDGNTTTLQIKGVAKSQSMTLLLVSGYTFFINIHNNRYSKITSNMPHTGTLCYTNSDNTSFTVFNQNDGLELLSFQFGDSKFRVPSIDVSNADAFIRYTE